MARRLRIPPGGQTWTAQLLRLESSFRQRGQPTIPSAKTISAIAAQSIPSSFASIGPAPGAGRRVGRLIRVKR
jgi:hypothetical protein